MSQVLERLRGQYHDLDEKKQSRQTQSIDGLRLEKRRKLTSGGGHWGNSKFALFLTLFSLTQINAAFHPTLTYNALLSTTKVIAGEGEVEHKANHLDLRSETKTCSTTFCSQGPLCFHRLPFVEETACWTISPSDSGFFSIPSAPRSPAIF